QRGHSVTLLERAGQLGGQMRLASLAPGRSELLRGVGYLEAQLERLGVVVRLEVEATPERVLAERPEVVIVATGSDPAPFEAAADRPGQVCSVREALDGTARIGARVVVVDG